MKKIIQLALLVGITATTTHCLDWSNLVPSRVQNLYQNWQIRQKEIRQFKKLTDNNPLAKEYYWLEEINKGNAFAHKNIEKLHEEIEKLDQKMERIRKGERFEKSYEEKEIERLNTMLDSRNQIRSDNPSTQKFRLEKEIKDYEKAIDKNIQWRLKLQNKINKQLSILSKYQNLPQIKLRDKRLRERTGLGWGQE